MQFLVTGQRLNGGGVVNLLTLDSVVLKTGGDGWIRAAAGRVWFWRRGSPLERGANGFLRRYGVGYENPKR